MTEIALSFPWGRYHGTPWGRHVNEGAIDWPPSPWRLLRALYCIWQFREPELDREVVESVLSKLADAPTYHLPRYTTAATRHYLPGIGHLEGASAERDLAVDAFAVVPAHDEVRVRWNAALDPREQHVLRRLLSQLTYLGRAESLCDAHLSDAGPADEPLAVRPLPRESGDDAVDVLVPNSPLDLDALTVSTTQVRAGNRRRIPPGARMVRYSRPEPFVPSKRRLAKAPPLAEAVRWSLAGRALPSRHAAVAVATLLRRSAMSRAGSNGRPIPGVLHGKVANGFEMERQQGHRHAHWVAFGDADGRLLTTVVAWAHDGFDSDVVAGMAKVHQMFPRGIRDFGPQRIALEDWGDIEAVAPELVGPSRRWHSYTPFAPSIHRKKEPNYEAFLLSAVRRELEWRELPSDQVSVEMVPGAPRAYRTHRPDKERLRDSRRAWGLRLHFDEEVSGPIVLGALSHFGLGLFLPEK